VLEAIKNASSSLTATCATMRGLADDAVNRMAVASAAAAETTQRVKITSEATEELHGSIDHIGQETARALDMAKAAVGDTQRTQQTIFSLNDTAERIGAIVGMISTIASQTNLLALNATIESGACRRRRQGIRGGRRRSQGACQSDFSGHGGNLAAGEWRSERDQEIGR